MYEYTACKADGSRWRVAVPKVEEACTGGIDPPPPQRGKPCDFSCLAGEYLQTQGDEECHKCLPGTYSLGGHVVYDFGDKLPEDFTVAAKQIKDMNFGSQSPSEINCNQSNWNALGDAIVIQSGNRGGCRYNIILQVNLIRIGYVSFTYSYPGYSVTAEVTIKSGECQSSSSSPRHYPQATGKDSWKDYSIPLSPGPQTITWEVSFYDEYSDYSATDKMFKLKAVNVDGIAYASTCTLCPVGTFSEVGATSCKSCPADYYAPKKGMSECLPCNTTTHYSYSKASKCTERPLCKEKDYFATHTPCDNNDTTQIFYKWVEPKICRSDLPTSAKLPPSTPPEPCPPCNPGMSSANSTDSQCMVCPKGHYSDGREPCRKCPPATEPAYNIELKFWPNRDTLPDNVYASCSDSWYQYRCLDHAWQFMSSYIGTNQHNGLDTEMKLTVYTAGFRVSETSVGDDPGSVGEVIFVFETICDGDCKFSFHKGYDYEDSGEIESWVGAQSKREYSYSVKSTYSTRFSWKFKKGRKKENNDLSLWSDGDDSQSNDDSLDSVRIYSIKVVNTVDGGASQCVSCTIGGNNTVKHTMQSQCRGCPEGHYVYKKQCFPCPANTQLNKHYPIGIKSCLPCGPGTISEPGSVQCYSDCTFKDENGHIYNFTTLGTIAQNITGQRIFSSVGSPYSHFFSLDICHDKMRAHCGHQLGVVSGSQSEDKRSVDRDVWSHVCRATSVDRLGGFPLYIESVSLGDQLLAVISANENNTDFPIPSMFQDLRKHNETVLYYIFKATGTTANCPSGLSSFVALHCDVKEIGQGRMTLPLECRDGTCDGCIYGFVWHTALACPLCTENDYTQFEEKCNKENNKSRTMYTWSTPKHCFGGVELPPNEVWNCSQELQVVVKYVKQQSNILDYKGYIGIAMGVAALLVIVLVVLYLKNRKLEYKYQQLKQSGKEGDELPAPETCVQDSGDEDEVVYQQGMKPGKKLLKKLKGMAGKGKNDDMEDMDFQTVQLDPSSNNV